MPFWHRLRRSIRTILAIIGLSSMVAGLFSYFTSEPMFMSLGTFFQGVLDGFFISTLLSLYITVVRSYLNEFFRQFSFLVTMLVDSVIYLALFFVGRIIGQYIGQGSLDTFFGTQFLASVGLAYFILIGLSFLLQVNRLVGHNVLLSFLSGKYHTTVSESRVFMFLDLESSTQIAEELGNRRYHQLLNQFFHDLTDAVLETDGNIYKYVGDEVIVTWAKKNGLKKANCVRCFFLIETRIEREAEKYRREFGKVPSFRAGVHGGEVIAGEIGDVKQEIAYLGDVLNTTARIMAQCREKGRRLLVSGYVIERMEKLREYEEEDEGVFQPRGKQEMIRLYGMRKREIDLPLKKSIRK